MSRQNLTVTSAADSLGMRRATLSARLNAHIAFAPSLLAELGALLGVRASELTARAEAVVARAVAAEPVVTQAA